MARGASAGDGGACGRGRSCRRSPHVFRQGKYVACIRAWLGGDSFGILMRVCYGGGADQVLRWADLRFRHIIVEESFSEAVRGIVQSLAKRHRCFIKREGDFLIDLVSLVS